MTKWHVSAEFTMDVRDENEARRIALEFIRMVSEGTPITTDGGRSPEVAMYELASDPIKAAGAVSLVLIGQAADDADWLEISDISTSLKQI